MKKAIVVGTGAGGLAAAIKLAEQGYEVTALEAAKQLGGYLNPFARKHYHFDPGVHYMGQLGAGETTAIALGRLGLDADELFCPMDEDGFDVLRFPELEVRIPRGLGRFHDRLCQLFPEDRADLDRFFVPLRRFARLADTVQQVPMRGWRWADLPSVLGLPWGASWMERTFADVLGHYFRNPKLRAVMAGQGGDYGLPPSRTPAILGLGVFLHYITGAWFPRGGSGAFRDALVERGRALGAEYRRRAPVAEILLGGGRVRGVRLESGERLDADVVVSAIDPSLTFGSLLPRGLLSPKLQAKVDHTVPSLGSFCVFLGMERDLREHGLGAFNVWDYPSWDLEALYALVWGERMPEDWFFFLSPNSLKDDLRSMAPPGCSTLEVVTLAPFKPFSSWEGLKAFQRGPEYAALKEKVAGDLLASVERRWPGLVGDVVVQDIATPVTNSFYAGAVEGGAYGPAAIPSQHGKNAWRPRAPVDGLYLAGAGVFGGGVAPCLMSGLAAAGAVRKDTTEAGRGRVFGFRGLRKRAMVGP